MKCRTWTIPALALLVTALALLARPAPASAEGEVAPPAPVPQAPGFHKLKYATKVGDKNVKMAYALYLPVGYEKSKTPCPTLIFLHGGGECGEDWNGLFIHGPAMEVQQHPNSKFEQSFPFILICPQCPPRGQRWDQPEMIKGVINLLDDLAGKIRIDKDRVYVTGLSMGGKGTWLVAMEAPDHFAAIAPLAADTLDPRAAQRLLRVPTWAGAGGADGGAADGSRKMGDLINKAGGQCKVSILPGVDHGVWPMFYESPTFYEWLLAHKRGTPGSAPPQAPWPRAKGHYLREFEYKAPDQVVQLTYSLYLPDRYAPLGQPAPMLVFLHGWGDTRNADIGAEVNGICMDGPDLELERKGNERFRSTFPMIVLSPQLPPGKKWDAPEMTKAVSALVEEVTKKLPVDKTRVYLSGYNAGGASLSLATQDPDRYAAVLPIITEGGFNPPGNLDALKTIAVWAFVTESDGGAIGRFNGLFAQSKLDNQLNVITKANEGELKDVYRTQQVYDWLLKHKRTKAK